MRIYTGTGDQGETSLRSGRRVSKSHPRIDAYGQVDELNAQIGFLRAAASDWDPDRLLESIQSDLMIVGAELAVPPGVEKGPERIRETDISRLEKAIDSLEADLAPLSQFILPGGSEPACRAHIARSVCRRAERAVSGLIETEGGDLLVLCYLNRLSDLLFVLARSANHALGLPDSVWTSPRSDGGSER